MLSACTLRAVAHINAQRPTLRETDWIFLVLAMFLLVCGVILVRYFEGRLIKTAAVGAAALLVSSSIGALVPQAGTRMAGATPPAISHFHQPFRVKASAEGSRPDSLRLEIQFNRPGSPLDDLLARVALGELGLYLRVPVQCTPQTCEMSIAYPDGSTVSAVRDPLGFEIRFPTDHPLVRDASESLTLVFTFSGEITLTVRDIGTPARTRADRLLHEGQSLALSHDRVLFVRFMFVDKAGRPHAALY